MTRLQAVELIGAGIDSKAAQSWADLGCGSGTFTTALASLLPSKSTIHAVDIQPQSFPSYVGEVQVRFYEYDFTKDDLPFSDLDGILMANSLHYVSEPLTLIKRLSVKLKQETGRFLIVEYDRRNANRWVPYPIPFNDAVKLFAAAGYNKIIKTGERPSRYGQATIYAITACRV